MIALMDYSWLSFAVITAGAVAAIVAVGAETCRRRTCAVDRKDARSWVVGALFCGAAIAGVAALLPLGDAFSNRSRGNIRVSVPSDSNLEVAHERVGEKDFYVVSEDGEKGRLPYRDYILPTLGLAATILLLYSFLNASTLGRLAWPARALSLILLAALYLAMAYSRGWLG